jgi:hypothetical protein
MIWSAFKTLVDGSLAVERKRLGAQTFIDAQVRIAVGDLQSFIPYYRKGITTTLEEDDLSSDGFASKGSIPRGAALRELYHVKTGSMWVRRPMVPYEFSLRNDLRAGVLSIGTERSQFRFVLDKRDGGKTFWVYPRVTEGYAVQIVWDAIIGRTNADYLDADEVPFDEPFADAVHEFVKWKLTREVDRNVSLSREYRDGYRLARAKLFAEAEERQRLKVAESQAGCVPQPCAEGMFDNGLCACGDTSVSYASGYCPEIVIPQDEWVMFGDSGQQTTIADTIAVATAVKAVDPQFIVHLGDAAYAENRRAGSEETPSQAVGTQTGGADYLIYDLLLKHYWNFLPDKFYLTMGNHDLETGYGQPFLNVLTTTSGLIGHDNLVAHLLHYTFARGNVRFIVVNSGLDDSDPLVTLDTELTWVESTINAASEPWVIVCVHRPAACSDVNHYPGSAVVKQFTDELLHLGVDLVVSGHAHNYERLRDATGLTHVICGTGGSTLRGAAATVSLPGSQFFYNSKHGFLRFTATATELQWEMRTVDNEVIDRVTMKKT